MDMVARAGNVAEKVGLALGTGRVERRRFLAQQLEHLADGVFDSAFDLGKTLALDLDAAGLLEVVELFDELHEADGALDRAEELVEIASAAAAGIQRAAKQREASVDARLLARHASRRGVIRTGVGDATADDLAVLIEQNRLGGGRSEIDSDKGLHQYLPESAFKRRKARPRVFARSSGNSSPAGS